MDKDTSEIVKLTERISKDPKSKLFVPLAEEYKKQGDFEMSIHVLTEGLKNNPGYVTARSFLGRLLLETGDLAGAQKELEEVVKAIPDNLLAQRKLGDIYVLQGRGKDALARYKTALSLNPGDKEIASLASDLEAGRDVSGKVPKPKARPVPVQPPEQQAQASPPVRGGQQAGTPPKVVPAAVTVPAAGPDAAATPAAPAAAPKPAPPRGTVSAQPAPSTREEAEDVEEVVELEPIEPAAGGPQLKEAAFDISEPLPAAPHREEEAGAPLWGKAGAEAEAPTDRDTPAQGSEPGADDFNTNTLAELYISQGFYDKAIEIYQQMLADRQGNQVLIDKLARLRAMAGESDAPARETAGTAFVAPPAGPSIEPRQETPLKDRGVAFEPGEYLPPAADDFGQAPSGGAPREAARQPLPEPVARPEQKTADAAVRPGPKTPTTRRKETIDRLEHWLTNIMKEKH